MKPVEPSAGREARREYAREMLQRLSTSLAKMSEPRQADGLLARLGPPEPSHHSPYWYRVQYLLASDFAHRQLDAWEAEHPEQADTIGEQAATMSTDLAIAIEEQLVHKPTTTEHRFFLQFLADIRPSALLLWVGVVTLLEKLVPGVSDESQPTNRTMLGELKGWKKTRNPASVSWIVRLLETQLQLSARSRYNLACYYAVVAMLARKDRRLNAEARERAEDAYSRQAVLQLDLAAPGLSAATLQWARRDPCFRELGEGRHRREFEQVLTRPAPASAAISE
jgi:hypothetical protein